MVLGFSLPYSSGSPLATLPFHTVKLVHSSFEPCLKAIIGAYRRHDSNRKDGKFRKVKCSPFSPSAFPFTLILLGFVLYALQLGFSCRHRTTQTQQVPLRILH